MNDRMFVAHGKTGRKSVMITAYSFDTAVRAAHQILNENREMESVAVKDRKGNVLRVVRR